MCLCVHIKLWGSLESLKMVGWLDLSEIWYTCSLDGVHFFGPGPPFQGQIGPKTYGAA